MVCRSLLHIVVALVIVGISNASNIVNADVEQGTLQGVVENGVNVFRGIPYAAAPTGDLRWTAPSPPTAWQGVRDASEWPNACAQDLSQPAFWNMPPGTKFSEDCLYLNVFAPSVPHPDGLPVFVWIHGGSLDNGASSQLDYQGNALARNDTIVVTINYRLNMIGWLAHPALAEEQGADLTSGNYGFLDQVEALKWVQTNIHVFGGDASRVTIAGESAGGSSVCFHLLHEPSWKLYSRAVIESGACYSEVSPNVAALDHGVKVAEALGCSGKTAAGSNATSEAHTDPASVRGCLRAVPWETVLQVAAPLRMVDGTTATYGHGAIFEKFPYHLFKEGRFNKVPLLIGSNRDEAAIFLPPTPIAPKDWEAAVKKALGPLSVLLLHSDTYKCEQTATDCLPVLRAFWGDMVLVCPNTLTAELVAKHGVHVWAYEFAYVPSWLSSGPYANLVAHAAELDFVFNTVDMGFRQNVSDIDLRVADEVSSRWLSFVHGDAPAKDWAQFSHTAQYPRAVLGVNMTMEYEWRQDYCESWKKVFEIE